MKIANVSLLNAATPILAALALLGCDPDGTETTSSTTDAGGSVSTGDGGATTSSSGQGGTGGAGPSTMVTVHTVRSLPGATLAPMPGIRVFSSDASGKLAENLVSDASGLVQIRVPIEGSVSAAQEVGPNHTRMIRTWFDLGAASDVTLLLSGENLPTPPDNEPMPKVLVLVTNLPPAAKDVIVVPSCIYPPIPKPATFPSTSVELTDYKGCAGEDTYDVLVRAVDASGETIASGLADDVAFTPGASTTTAVSLDTSNLADATVDIHGATGALGYTAKLLGLGDFTGYQPWLNDPLLAGIAAAGPSYTASVAMPTNAYDRPTWQVAITWPEGGTTIVEKGMKGSAPSIDADGAAIPRVIGDQDLSDPAHPVVKWSPLGTTEPTLVTATFSWLEMDPSDLETRWTGYRRPTPTPSSARMPDLPPEIAAWPSDLVAPVLTVSGVSVTAFAELAGYDAFLQDPFHPFSSAIVSYANSIDGN